MKPGDLRRFKDGDASGLAAGKIFLVIKRRISEDDTHLISFLLDGRMWELASAWVLRNSEELNETR